MKLVFSFWGAGQAQGLSLPVRAARGFATRGGFAIGGTDMTPAPRRQRGMVWRGALRGFPPAQGRAEGPTAQLQRLAVSDWAIS